ncbi:hypothetical protein POVCU2_0005600 [Plasmodium ovale curtisi]|uniref:Uncharacterized protein n=1 Tax=Plasmodium ovale curtisi TaxID=864141 RepID=A0A1A8VJ33_PLAOA|nr:hypothetical protein POVCU2_0005600 [Plasmodium ovale curtisi]SBS81169.1 hypothetical protein POVCU1_004920 [Plasmodium ovale curtisi]
MQVCVGDIEEKMKKQMKAKKEVQMQGKEGSANERQRRKCKCKAKKDVQIQGKEGSANQFPFVAFSMLPFFDASLFHELPISGTLFEKKLSSLVFLKIEVN